MILRSLRVQGWRCFADAVEIGPVGEGLNVVHGPNGSGKSTLLWALARGLFDSYKVTGADIESLRPWGRQLTPRVEIEFSHDGAEYRLAKQFLNAQQAKLDRLENGSYVALAEATQADDHVRQMLSAEPPKRGVCSDRHWGFAQVLWATQGALHIEQLSDGTRSSIHDSLGAQLAGPGGEEIEQRAARLYDGIFTPKGKLKGGAGAPPIVKLQEEMDALRDQRAELAERLTQFDDASRRIEDLQNEQSQAEQQAVGLENDLRQATETARKFDQLSAECAVLAETEKNAENAFQRLNERVERIAKLKDRQRQCEAERKQLNQLSPAVEEEWQRCQEEARAAKSALKEVHRRRTAIDEKENLARQAKRMTDAAAVVKASKKQVSDIEIAHDRCEALRKAISELIAPDAAALKKIQKAARQRDDARLQLDAALIKVTITAQRTLDVDVLQAEKPGRRGIDENVTLELRGAPEVAFHLDGIATIRATGPTESAEQLREKVAQAAVELEELTAGFGTQDIGKLEASAEQAQILRGQLGKADVRLDTLLAGKQLADIRGEQSRAQAKVDEIVAKYPQWQQALPDVARLESDAEEVRTNFDRDIDTAQQRTEAADEALEDARKKRDDFQQSVNTLDHKRKELAAQLEDAEKDGLDTAQRNERLDDAALKWRAEKAILKQKSDELAKLGDDPHEVAKTLREQRESLLTQASQATGELIRAETQLQTIISDAPYSKLAGVEERIESLEQDIAREQLSYDAIGLLHQTFVEQKREAHAAVIEPVQRRANRTLQRIAGGRFEGIQFDESLLPKGVRPAASDEDVVLDYLSGGEQEQVHFAVRLALAEVAFGQQRQLVVLDDAFTATDTPRLARVIKILEETAQRFQILLLSCHPERYRHLQNVKFFDLTQLAAGEAETV